MNEHDKPEVPFRRKSHVLPLILGMAMANSTPSREQCDGKASRLEREQLSRPNSRKYKRKTQKKARKTNRK